jgi:hypothetical protein
MADDYIDVGGTDSQSWRGVDPAERRARAALREFFEERREEVFFARQLEIFFEKQFFHWITARVLRTLVLAGEISGENRQIPSTGGAIHLFWNRRYRYYKRAAENVVELVSAYANPNVAGAIGIHGEGMVLGGFAACEFVLKGRETSEYGGRRWTQTEHDFDFIFERDGAPYAVEVKNTLGYPEDREIAVKIRIAQALAATPVFVARMMPKTMINAIWKAGGFALILKYQLYPYSHRALARRVADGLGLPVDAPRRLNDGTMKRFVDWHVQRVEKA